MKFREYDIDSLTVYYLQEHCKKYNANYDELINIFLDCYNKQYDEIYQEGYEQGNEDGDESGFERGWDEATNNDYEEKKYTEDDLRKEREDAFKDGYEAGYKCGVEWQLPKYKNLEGI